MRDCANVAMRELLPDLLHDRLQPAVRADLERHVAGCAECRAELALLRRVVAAAPTPAVDVGRIVGAVPAYRAMAAWRRPVVSWSLRAAAAILIVAGGIGLLRAWSDRSTGPGSDRIATVPAPKPAPDVAITPVAPAPRPATTGASTQVPGRSASRQVATELAVGESFHDLSDSDLRDLLGELEKLDAVTSPETEVVVPGIGRGTR